MFQNSYDVLQKEYRSSQNYCFMCHEFDEALGTCPPLGTITEFCGGPGSGKSQMCFQLCVNVQRPNGLNGLEGAAVFIDTNHSFSHTRIHQIASACVNDYNNQQTTSHLTAKSITDNIYYTHVENHVRLIGAVQNLKTLLKQHPNIKLIVIDSFSYVFRQYEDSLKRTRQIFQLLTDLHKLANEYICAIVITNELTTRLHNSAEPDIVPALGDSVRTELSLRVMFGNDEVNAGRFYAHIEKSLYKPERTVQFKVSKDGVSLIKT